MRPWCVELLPFIKLERAPHVVVQPTLSPARLQLDCSENVDEEAVEQWINEDSTSECCEVLSDDDIVSRVTCGSEETRNFEECPESDEVNLVTHQKLSHGDALVDTEVLLNYLEQEDENTSTEKIILRNRGSIIHRRVNGKQKDFYDFILHKNSEIGSDMSVVQYLQGKSSLKNFLVLRLGIPSLRYALKTMESMCWGKSVVEDDTKILD
ncbi:hypothetical protein AVEN_215246-1 [Araneus ventricosus]|uniref:Uncharacterized protein n=1 Tax=Araneus ventricosus TaxID=182803 RepID=A0A4Y2M493_ARAVE|nr:hypothetical protein AVEN_215246-1 [Araneus ventricosus]